MHLLLVRHASAEDRAAFAAAGRDDDRRPLTERGARRMRRGAAGLASELERLDAIATSPLVRAVQTADILAEAFPRAARETLPALAPGGDRPTLLAWLAGQGRECVAMVGHEPDLSELAAWLLTAEARPFMDFKKGAVCLLVFDREPRAGDAELIWHLAPRQLRALAKAGA